jgi:hypothetical protein
MSLDQIDHMFIIEDIRLFGFFLDRDDLRLPVEFDR